MISALLAATFAFSAAQAHAADRLVSRVMHDERIPALSLGVARGAHVLYLRGYGAHADGYTIYRIGSLTKQFTAALVLGAAERGELRLDERVRDDITVADLLGQTSGLRDDGPALAPGSAWNYDNVNYLLLGDALRRATHTSFAQLVRSRIAAPLRLPSTSVELPLARNAASDLAQAPRDLPEAAGAAASMSSNAPDLLRWLDALRAGSVVSRADFTRMTTAGRLADGRSTQYGYGFFVTAWYGRRIAEHPGYLDGFSAIDALDLDDGTAIVVLTNADRVDLAPLAQSLLAIAERITEPRIGTPPENEDPRVTALLERELAPRADGALAAYGALRMTEFLRREGDVDVYRLTFERAQLLARVRVRDGKIVRLDLEPAP